MRPQKISDNQLTAKMLEVLRSRGYDGSSLNELALVGGLKKASLYHRYPGGKEELVQSVLMHYKALVSANVLQVLSKKKKTKKKIQSAFSNIKEIYTDGQSNCLYRALTMESGLDLYGQDIASQCKEWIQAFEALGRDLGYKKKKAKKLALEGLIKIQGALVVSRIFNDKQIFQDAVDEIQQGYHT
jgi:AcrR family transcriptional regulator